MAYAQVFRISKISLTCNLKNIRFAKKYYTLIQPQILKIKRNSNSTQICRQIFISQVKQTNDGYHVGSNHTFLWVIERVVTTALLGIIPYALIYPSFTMDCFLAISLVLHNHWGIVSVSSDYLRPNTVGSLLSKAGIGVCYILSFLTLAGFFKLIKDDYGLAASIKKLWNIPLRNEIEDEIQQEYEPQKKEEKKENNK